MGYYMTQQDASFTILAENKPKVFDAMKELASKSERNHWVINSNILNAHTLADAFHEWAYDIEEDDSGNIVGVEFIADKLGDEAILFSTIAPFVEHGSYIEMLGEDGTLWRWVFKDGGFKEIYAEISWGDDV